MAVQRTLSIIKPDAVAKDGIGRIIGRLEKEELRPIAIRMTQLSKQQAEGLH